MLFIIICVQYYKCYCDYKIITCIINYYTGIYYTNYYLLLLPVCYCDCNDSDCADSDHCIAVPRGGDRPSLGEPGGRAADREREGRDHRAALPAVNCNRGGDQAGQTVLDLTSGM